MPPRCLFGAASPVLWTAARLCTDAGAGESDDEGHVLPGVAQVGGKADGVLVAEHLGRSGGGGRDCLGEGLHGGQVEEVDQHPADTGLDVLGGEVGDVAGLDLHGTGQVHGGADELLAVSARVGGGAGHGWLPCFRQTTGGDALGLCLTHSPGPSGKDLCSGT